MTTICYLCQRDGNSSEQFCHKHHVYEGRNRQASERAGFVMYLCPRHHAEIHKNYKLMEWAHKQTQRDYEQTHTREEFMKIIGRNYL